ncbi:MAG: LLM class flavin-dependent oxidoreductase [Egibacteraceae bacterium]
MAPRFGILEVPRSVAEAVEHARIAEAVGFDLVGMADSQSVFREVYGSLAVVAAQTDRVMLGPTVTNPVSRHPAVTASAIATVDEISGGRALLGVGSGDSAVLNLGKQPFRLATMRAFIAALKDLMAGREVTWEGASVHTGWIGRAVPVYLAAEGPKTLELAGELADGVICGMGVGPGLVERSLAHVRAGARRAGRRVEDIDVWVLARVNIGEDRTALVRQIRQELASSAHHAFRFTLEGKEVPPQFIDVVRRIQRGYVPSAHEDLGESANARLMDDAEFLDYMAWRFGVVGTPTECAEQVERIGAAGADGILFTGFVPERAELIETIGVQVAARVR